MSDVKYDYVIVGAGTAGSVLAARLSENPDNRVLLLEAGGNNDDPRIRTPALFGGLPNSRFDWAFRTAPQAELFGRQIAFPRGRGIGGTGSINYMIYLRGHPCDYDGWAQRGCAGWSWREVLPVFRRLEGNRVQTGPLHGNQGPLVIGDQSERYELTETFLAACGQAAIAFNEDMNGEDNAGCGYFPATIEGNERASTARAYLEPAYPRPNLTVESGATVLRIELDKARAVGVRYLCAGNAVTAHAGHEVILCAGAIGSPHLLLLSGIGAADALVRSGVVPRHDLPGVGANLQDHFHFRSRWEITKPLTLHGRAPDEVARIQARYDEARQGPLTTNHFESGAFLASDPARVAAPDIELLMIPYFISLDAPEYRPPDRHGFTISGFPTRPASRGTITLASADPLDRPVIDPAYLSEPSDMKLMVEIVKRARDIAAQPAFDAIRGVEISPGPDVQTDAQISDAVRRISSTSFHPVGTCRMGNDAMAVVDPELRVRGIDGLRVVDASVIPDMITGHPNAATAMIAEMAADRISGANVVS